jgi:hypothetical protein
LCGCAGLTDRCFNIRAQILFKVEDYATKVFLVFYVFLFDGHFFDRMGGGSDATLKV